MDAPVQSEPGGSSEDVVTTRNNSAVTTKSDGQEDHADEHADTKEYHAGPRARKRSGNSSNIPSRGISRLQILSPSPSHTDESPENVELDLSGNKNPDKTIPLGDSGSQSRRFQWRMRPADDDEEQNWWFASTAIPLIAATTGPLANVLSIAALVTKWRNHVPIDGGPEIPDPHWCIALNACSLACGFAGNLFLLFNFTRKIRYIIALPMSIIFWYIATGILITILACMNSYLPPAGPEQVYSQGFWHAVLAAIFYMISSMILMINMLGYFLGHYPQHFTLTDHQRTLILQTMMFFIWLAGGGGVFATVCDWSFVDALYFCDVTILTVGFGDFVPENDPGRGLVLPYSVGGIIILGLMVNSIRKFSLELSREKVIKRHVEHKRARTIDKVVTTSTEIRQRMATLDHRPSFISSPMSPREIFIKIPAGEEGKKPLHVQGRRFAQKLEDEATRAKDAIEAHPSHPSDQPEPDHAQAHSPPNDHEQHHHFHGQRRNSFPLLRPKSKLILLRAEKDRFLAMRAIQRSMARFKQWYALSLSVTAFSLLWCLGAVVFWVSERNVQGMTYFRALYFCYVSLLTIGYGDLAPQSNVGKPFFIVWSLIAVPTMTILVSDMSDTVIDGFNRATFVLGDWTILPKAGLWKSFLDKNKWAVVWRDKFAEWKKQRKLRHELEKRIAEGFPAGPDVEQAELCNGNEMIGEDGKHVKYPTLEALAAENLDDRVLARRLTLAIRRVADDLKLGSAKKYEYEEWVEFTRLIRFSSLIGKKGRFGTVDDADVNGAVGDGTSVDANDYDDNDNDDDGDNDEVNIDDKDADDDAKSDYDITSTTSDNTSPTGQNPTRGRRKSKNDHTNATGSQVGSPGIRSPAKRRTRQPSTTPDTQNSQQTSQNPRSQPRSRPAYNTTHSAISQEEASRGLINWDWIGPDSPMLADQTEPEWVLDRLCESLDRYMRRALHT